MSAEGKHATVKLYIVFSIILCVMTFLEWAIFRFRHEWNITSQIMVPLLLAMSLVKFTMVCGWYMHLRYDHKLLTKIFVASMTMIVATGAILGALLG